MTPRSVLLTVYILTLLELLEGDFFLKQEKGMGTILINYEMIIMNDKFLIRHSYVLTKLLSSFLDQQDDDLSPPSVLFDWGHCLCSVQGDVGRGDVGQPKALSWNLIYNSPSPLFLLLNMWQSWKSSDEGQWPRWKEQGSVTNCAGHGYESGGTALH